MWSFNRILNVTRFDRNFVLTLFDIISLYPNREVADGIIDFVVRHYMCYVLWSTKLKIFFETTAITFIRSICNGVSFVRINRIAVNHSEAEKTEALLQSLNTVTGGRNLTSKRTILLLCRPRYNL